MTDKIAKEVAEQDFNRFVEAMALEVDPTNMDEDDHKGFTQQKDRIIRAIMSGSLVVNDNGEPVFTPQRTNDADAITFHEPTGNGKKAWRCKFPASVEKYGKRSK